MSKRETKRVKLAKHTVRNKPLAPKRKKALVRAIRKEKIVRI